MKGNSDNFDRSLALDPPVVLGFIADTQPDIWTTLSK